jgi:ubiquinone/menaquinone biosynthesis C-methylase UbiE
MAPQEFKDLFSKQSKDYQKFRPTYPPELFAYLAEQCAEKKLVLDLGTGNGQAAVALAPYFEKVIGRDPSQKQIDAATSHPKVVYQTGPAEKLEVEDASVDLITVAQAFHWFRHADFFKEVQRVLKPRGVLAIWVYNLCQITPEIDATVWNYYEGLLGPYWEPERRLLEQNFKTIQFPFVEKPAREFVMTSEWSFEHLVGYLGTWSALQTYRSKTGQDPIPNLEKDLQKAWGNQKNHEVKWTLSLRIFQK